MKRLTRRVLSYGFIAAFSLSTASAAVTNAYWFDEYGHGQILTNGLLQTTFSAALGPDPTGGLPNWNVLIYTLPFAGTAGDILVRDPAIQGNPILDVLRFDGFSHLIVYSDSLEGYDTPADTPGPPDPFLTPLVLVDKVHVNPLLAYAEFAPLVGEPGYDASNPIYHFLDPGVVPEPATGLLVLTGLAALGLARARRKAASKHHSCEG